MENLHLSYREVYKELPYILLLAMSTDKLRVEYGEKEEVEVKKMSGRELMRQKQGG